MKDPIIIVGAGRSGTNALRDAMCNLDCFHTWPCDEINYIWRHGNRSHRTDQLGREHATDDVVDFLRGTFVRRASMAPRARLVEKTCATSLRVGFAHEVFPRARFLHIVRDGRDVVASAMERWTAPLDLPYIFAKARFVPKSDLPFYAAKYLAARASRIRSGEGRLSWWGPRFEGMESLGADTPLEEVAAVQWARCVSEAMRQLAEVPVEQIYTLRYQQLVEDPEGALRGILRWVDESVQEAALLDAASTIHAGSVYKWKRALSADQIARIDPIVRPALVELGIDL